MTNYIVKITRKETWGVTTLPHLPGFRPRNLLDMIPFHFIWFPQMGQIIPMDQNRYTKYQVQLTNTYLNTNNTWDITISPPQKNFVPGIQLPNNYGIWTSCPLQPLTSPLDFDGIFSTLDECNISVSKLTLSIQLNFG